MLYRQGDIAQHVAFWRRVITFGDSTPRLALLQLEGGSILHGDYRADNLLPP